MIKFLISLSILIMFGGCATIEHGYHIQVSPVGYVLRDYDGKFTKQEVMELLGPFKPQGDLRKDKLKHESNH
uniref:Lipoprotein n=1 Tax=viral metagenome TaxID=1070528 RepID=A0A6M3KWH1_9ZZZZ